MYVCVYVCVCVCVCVCEAGSGVYILLNTNIMLLCAIEGEDERMRLLFTDCVISCLCNALVCLQTKLI